MRRYSIPSASAHTRAESVCTILKCSRANTSEEISSAPAAPYPSRSPPSRNPLVSVSSTMGARMQAFTSPGTGNRSRELTASWYCRSLSGNALASRGSSPISSAR